MENGLLALADDSYQRGVYAPAVATYLHVVKSLPESDTNHKRAKSSLISALCNWALSSDLDKHGIQLLLKGYQDAMTICPINKDLLNNYGGLIFRLGYHTESLDYFRQALVLSSDYLRAQENLDNACGKVAERWHFRMLNDVVRNSAFRRAIDTSIEQIVPTVTDNKLVVLDIGTGAGLLSLFVVQSLATRGLCTDVYSCEVSSSMFKMAADIFAACKLSDVIKLINKRSNDIVIPDDIPFRSHIVVTETFDSGLLGEHILCTLSHAWKNLFSTDCLSVVIPRGAAVYITAVQSEAIRRQNRYLNAIGGIETRGISIVCSTACDWPRSDNAKKRHCCDKKNPDECFTESNTELCEDEDEDVKEPYTSERLMDLRCGFKLLSSPIPLLNFNFADMEEVINCAQGVSRDLSVVIKEAGRLDALVVWFDLHLNEHATITTSPLATDLPQAKCWEQAVYPVISTHLNTEENLHDIHVSIGETLQIKADIKHALNLRCIGITRQNISDLVVPAQQSYDPGVAEHPVVDSTKLTENTSCSSMVLVLSDENIVQRTLSCDKISTDSISMPRSGVSSLLSRDELFFVSRESIGKLNDEYLVESCVTSLTKMADRCRFDCGSNFKMAVLAQDLFMFPVVCLRSGLVDEVCFVGLNKTRRNIILRLMDLNRINVERVTFLDHCSQCPSQVYQALWVDIIDSRGPMLQNILEDITLARHFLMSPDGCFIPASLSIRGVLIQSDSLLRDSTVTRDSTFEFDDVANLFNNLRIKSHYSIELSTLQCTRLTEAAELLNINLNERTQVDSSTASKPTKTVCVTCSQTSPVTALVYWFELTLTDGVVIDTSDSRSHWSQAAVLFYDELSVMEEGRYVINTVCDNGYLGVTITPMDEEVVV